MSTTKQRSPDSTQVEGDHVAGPAETQAATDDIVKAFIEGRPELIAGAAADGRMPA